MEILSAFWNWFNTNIFSQAAIFMALVCITGQLLAKIPVFDALVGGIKCYIGYTVFTSATGAMTTTFRPILNELRVLFDVNVIVSDSYYGLSCMKECIADLGGNLGAQGLIMGISFVICIMFAVLRKVTKVRTLGIQGHRLTNEAMYSLALVTVLYPTIEPWLCYTLAVLYFVARSTTWGNFTVEACQDLTDGIGMGVDHNQMILDRVWWELGKKIEKKSIEKTGKKPKKYDDLVLPGWMSVFSDVYVSAFFAMFIFFGVCLVIIGKPHMVEAGHLAESASYLMYIVKTAFVFPCQLVILFTGMRMFVAEIMTGFDGLSKSFLKGIVPCIDCAAFYGFAGNGTAITMGFIVGTCTMITCTIIQTILGFPIIVMMGFTQMMFDNATVSVFAHHRGGIKGSVLGSMTVGIVDTFLGALASYWTGFYIYGGISAPSDTSLQWGLGGWMWKFGIPGFIAFCLVILALPNVYYYFFCKDKKAYWLVAEDYEAYKEYMAEKGTPVVIDIAED